MKVAVAVSVLAALAAKASPVKRQAAVTDTDILNYALTLEYLEDNFYHGALAQFDQAAFAAAGYPPWVRNRISQIAEHEASHVSLLAGALGSAATQACNYSFPYTDPTSFLGLSAVLENVGVSAYLGAAASIQDKTYLTVAGAILTTEARHQGWVNSAVNKVNPWSGPYDTPLGFSQVYSLAAPFITGCPASNPALPVQAFPTLTVTGAADGASATLAYTSKGDGEYFILYSGLSQMALPISNNMVQIPSTLQGIAYGVIASTNNASMVTDQNTVAGPAILNLPFSSSVSNPM